MRASTFAIQVNRVFLSAEIGLLNLLNEMCRQHNWSCSEERKKKLSTETFTKVFSKRTKEKKTEVQK